MEPLILTVAAVGAELSLEQQPNLPVLPDAVARDAERCRAAGASIYHLHVRDDEGRPTMDVDRFRVVRDAIAARTDLIVQFTTGGAVTDPVEARSAPLALKPEMATLTTGTVNFGDDVFKNPRPVIDLLYARMRAEGTLPEFEIFEPGMIANAEHVYAEHGSDHHKHFDFVLGVPGAMPAWEGALEFLSSKLTRGATWSATGIGKDHQGVARRTIELGGHVRTGFEDVRYLERGVPATGNDQLIARVAEMARAGGREVADPAAARELLGLG